MGVCYLNMVVRVVIDGDTSQIAGNLFPFITSFTSIVCIGVTEVRRVAADGV